MYDINVERNRYAIKYVDAVFDSRDGTVFSIKLRQITGHDDVLFRVDNEKGVAEVYSFLDKPMR